MRGINFPRHRLTITTIIVAGTGEANFVVTHDADGARIPKRIKIVGIGVKPAVATIRAIRLFSNELRIAAANDLNYSMVYEDNYTAFSIATDELGYVNPDQIYIDDDAPDEIEGTIWGTVEIQAGAADSSFMIDIYYFDM